MNGRGVLKRGDFGGSSGAKKTAVGAAGPDFYLYRSHAAEAITFIRGPRTILIDALINIAALEKHADIAAAAAGGVRITILTAAVRPGACNPSAVDFHNVIWFFRHDMTGIYPIGSATVKPCRELHEPESCYYVTSYCFIGYDKTGPSGQPRGQQSCTGRVCR